MITHTRFTIADSYSLLSSFCIPGVCGKFEVRAFIDRVERPRLIVIHDKWHKAERRERIAPLLVVQFEADGNKKCIQQKDEKLLNINKWNEFSRHAMGIFNEITVAN